MAEGAVDPSFNPVMALRLSVLKDSAVWAILSEVSGPNDPPESCLRGHAQFQLTSVMRRFASFLQIHIKRIAG